MKVVQVSACLLILHCVLCVAENERRSSRLGELLLRVLEAAQDDRVERYGEGGPQPGMGGGEPSRGGDKPEMGGHMPGMGGHMPGMGGHMPGMGGHMPGMGGHMPGMGGHMPGMGGHMPGMGGHRGNHTGAAGNRTMSLSGGRPGNQTLVSATFLRSLEGCGSSSASSASSEEGLGGLGDSLTEATDLCTENAAAMNDALLNDFCEQAQAAEAIFDGLSDADKKSPCTFADCDAPTPDEIGACVGNTIKTVAGVIEVAGGATGPIKVVLLEGVRNQMEELYDYFDENIKEMAPAPAEEKAPAPALTPAPNKL